jgi:hypothetical protein
MIQLIKIFGFVLSSLYVTVFLVKLIIQVRSDDINLEPMNISTIGEILLYLAFSYIITAIITLFL